MNCPVCFGGEDTAMRESLNAGIGVLMGVTVIVLACFARFVFMLARRAQNGVGSHFSETVMGSGVIFDDRAPKMTPDPITVSEK